MRTGLHTFRTHKTPADIDVFMVFATFAWSEVVGAQEAVIGQWDAAGSHTVVIGVVGHRAADAAGQAACEISKLWSMTQNHDLFYVEKQILFFFIIFANAISEWQSPLEIPGLAGLVMKQARQTWREQRKPRCWAMVGEYFSMHSMW